MYEDNCLCIHEVNKDILYKLNHNYSDVSNLLTFDDGLYSQFIYKDDIINKNRIYFICPSLVNYGKIKNYNFTAKQAMTLHFTNNNMCYMSLDDIKQLKDEGYIIGGHSYYHEHTKYKINEKYINKTKELNLYGSYLNIRNELYIRNDIEKMLEWFDVNLNLIPEHYCYPYNEKNNRLTEILESYGFKYFYDGENRIIIT